MKTTLTRDFYQRSDMTYTEYPEVNALIGITNEAAMGFSGKRSKPDFHFHFSSNARRDEYIQKYLTGLRETKDYKERRRKENKGKLTGSAAAAVEIRKALKKAFPGVKFSVRSDTFSMGDSVDVSWTDGPMDELVKSITDMFRYGRFDSMQDLSYSVDVDPRLNCSGAKYVHTNRNVSDEFRSQMESLAEQKFERNGIGYFAPWQYKEVELIMLGKDSEWLTAECNRLKELVLGGPLNEPDEDLAYIGIDTRKKINFDPNDPDPKLSNELEQVLTLAAEPVKLAKVIPFPIKQKPLSVIVSEVKKSINPDLTAIVLEAIKEAYPERIAGMNDEQAVLFAASLVAEMKNEYNLNI